MRYFVKVRTVSGAEYCGVSTELTDEEKEEILTNFKNFNKFSGFQLQEANHNVVSFNLAHVESISLETV